MDVVDKTDAVDKIKRAGEAISALVSLMAVAEPLIKVAEPLIKPAADAFDADAAKNAIVDAARVAREAADKAKVAIGDAANAAQDVLGKLVEAKDHAISEADRKKAAKALAKAVRDIRQTVLANATVKIAVTDYLKSKEKAGSFGPINSMPGCYVIATYKKYDNDRDLTDYVSVFVGKADNASKGVDLAISRDGDPDVYADVKYKQNVHIFVFNCLPEEIEGQYASLIDTFSDAEGIKQYKG